MGKMKYNPFRPGSMVGPGMFTGRVDELRSIEQCLFQTKHGNPQHFLIEGERGIGKSSLMLYANIIAKGVVHLEGTKANFLPVMVDVAGVQSELDIVREVALQLKSAMSEQQAVLERAKAVWDFLSKWELFGVKYNASETEESTLQDARDSLVRQVAALAESTAETLDGIFIMIDEADNPSEEANLGSFLKLFTERLAKRECYRVVIGLAGLPSTLAKLRASHESSPRLFEILSLKPLSIDERKLVVQKGLEEANKRNAIKTEITPDALNLISELSEGYPHFIQQFAYFAFIEDNDNIIDSTDVMTGAHKENGALMQLGSKYFSEMYHAKISSNDYRKVLDKMADHGDGWVARKDLIRETGLKDTTVNNALSALKNKNIILVDESRQGFYRLPTKSFAAWINAIKSVEEKRDGELDLL